jgi:hypothetical protein
MMRTIDLEIVRPGEAHNQLLSPLVNYTALCGRHVSATVTVPREHRAVLEMLRPLQEPESADPRERARGMDELGDLLKQVLSPVRGLTRELSNGSDEWVELRLLLTPMELSLLPFEMLYSVAARGELADSLQRGQRNIVLTRGIRGSGRMLLEWPVVPRILLIAASPGGIARPPLEAHHLALRKALDPWILPPREKETVANASALFTVLTNATLDDIRRTCAATRFDWVHMLVHGGQSPTDKKSFGIVLDGADHPEVVDGAQLAAALTPVRDGKPGVPPSMVVLCTCHSGRSDNVVYPGASVAQEIHASGVPVVIASQFPLTFRGSVIVADEMYRHLMDHGDPRIAVAACRNRLRQLASPSRHPDEASLVAYCEVGPEFTTMQRNLGTQRAYRMMETAREWGIKEKAEWRLSEAGKRIDSVERALQQDLAAATALTEKGAASERIPHKARVAALRSEIGELRGLQGSVYKRLAEIEFKDSPKRAEELLVQSCRAYSRASDINPNDHWAATQRLALELITSASANRTDTQRLLWKNAVAAAKSETHLWRHGTLAELFLLAPLLFPEDKTWADQVIQELETLLRNHGPSDERAVLTSTRRQFERYHNWWANGRPDPWIAIAATAQKAAGMLPKM